MGVEFSVVSSGTQRGVKYGLFTSHTQNQVKDKEDKYLIKAGVKFFHRQDLESKMELNMVYPQATPGNQVKDKEDEYLMKGSGPFARAIDWSIGQSLSLDSKNEDYGQFILYV